MTENGYMPSPQGRLEIKYVLQKGIFEKGNSFTKPSGPLGTSLS